MPRLAFGFFSFFTSPVCRLGTRTDPFRFGQNRRVRVVCVVRAMFAFTRVEINSAVRGLTRDRRPSAAAPPKITFFFCIIFDLIFARYRVVFFSALTLRPRPQQRF